MSDFNAWQHEFDQQEKAVQRDIQRLGIRQKLRRWLQIRSERRALAEATGDKTQPSGVRMWWRELIFGERRQ